MWVRSAVALVVMSLAAPVQAAPPSPEAQTGGRSCVSRLDGATLIYVSSQNFEPEFDAYDSVAADDFTVERRCRARSLVFSGNYGAGTGPARSETVTFYRDKDGWPGREKRSETVVGEDTNGTFAITFDRPIRFRPGLTYWISTQVNMDFAVGGQWGADLRQEDAGSPTSWRNPRDGFATGCVDWGRLVECYDDEQFAGGLMFELSTR